MGSEGYIVKGRIDGLVGMARKDGRLSNGGKRRERDGWNG